MSAVTAETTGRRTQQQRRDATRASVVVAAAGALAEDGYAALTTRSVAQRADVSQATVMNYFPTRGLLLTEAMGHLCHSIIDEVESLGAGLPSEDQGGPEMLDRLWERTREPGGVAIGQVWCAAWSDSELTPVVADFDRRHVEALLIAMQRVYPPDIDRERLAAYVELILASIKGILLLRPVMSPEQLDARWAIVRPLLANVAGSVLASADRH